MINKRGSTLTNWAFVILTVSLFLVVLQSQVLDPMNTLYNKNISTGLSTDAQSSIDDISSQSDVSSSDLDSAEVSRLSDGLTIVQVGTIGISTWRTLRDFFSGRLLSKLLTDNLDFPPVVAQVITIIILLSLIFIIVRIFMRGVTP